MDKNQASTSRFKEIYRVPLPNGENDGNGMSYYQPHIEAVDDIIRICVGGLCVSRPIKEIHAMMVAAATAALSPPKKPRKGDTTDATR